MFRNGLSQDFERVWNVDVFVFMITFDCYEQCTLTGSHVVDDGCTVLNYESWRARLHGENMEILEDFPWFLYPGVIPCVSNLGNPFLCFDWFTSMIMNVYWS